MNTHQQNVRPLWCNLQFHCNILSALISALYSTKGTYSFVSYADPALFSGAFTPPSSFFSPGLSTSSTQRILSDYVIYPKFSSKYHQLLNYNAVVFIRAHLSLRNHVIMNTSHASEKILENLLTSLYVHAKHSLVGLT